MRGTRVRNLVCLAIALFAVDVAMGSSHTQASLAIGDAGRVRINFNADWHFKLGSAENAEQLNFNDAGWESVGLPHSFSIPYFRASAFYTGDGWYRKAFTLAAVPESRRLSLEFEGAFQDAHVYVNGIEVAHHRGGYTGFPVDITNAIHTGQNV